MFCLCQGSKMSAQVKKTIDWKSVDGASEFPRRLHLEKATNQRYYWDAENMSRQSMDGFYILIPSLILEKLRRNTRQYGQQEKLMEGLVLKSFLHF